MKESYFYLAQISEQQGRPDQAISYYQKALQISRRDWTIYHNMGVSYLRAGDPGTAARYFQKALELNPQDIMAMNNLAVCYIGQGKYSEAESLLRQAVQSGVPCADAQRNLEQLFQDRSREP